MEHKEAESLADVLRQAIEENQSAFRFDEMEAINAWPRVIGQDMAKKTMRPYIRNGRMIIRVPSPPLRQELNMMRSAIAKAINAEVGKEIVTDLRFTG